LVFVFIDPPAWTRARRPKRVLSHLLPGRLERLGSESCVTRIPALPDRDLTFVASLKCDKAMP
ncbi:MAG: hypothetical protein ACOYOB_18580, partial [Myxococcota bacterium]